MALCTHNRPSGRLKKHLWWSRWNDVWRCGKAMRSYFLHPGHRKIQFGRSYLSDVLSGRMALRTHNLPSGCLNKRLVKSFKRCFKVPKAIRPDFLRPEHRKKRLAWSRLSDVLSRRMDQRSYNLYSERLKMLLCTCRYSGFIMSKGHYHAFSTFCVLQKEIRTKSRKCCFK
jgi:hypothetical protein